MAFAIFATACGGGGDDSSDSTRATASGSSGTTPVEQPQTGGVVTFASFIEPTGLDPIVAAGAGVVGGTEMAAIYDTVMRYNPETHKYDPKTAESMTSNVDFTQWTVKLRAGIKFTDGTDYNADALKFAVDRHRSGLPGAPPCEEIRACPRNTVSTSGALATLTDVKVVDPLTVQMTLSAPWPSFPSMLAGTAGMVPSPTAMKAACPADTKVQAKDCSFNVKPVGAGAFKLDSWVPKEAMVMSRNPGYWDGPVYLDGLKVINFSDSGGDKTYTALKTGTVQLAFLKNAEVIARSDEDKVPGITQDQFAGSMVIMNNGLSVNCANGAPPACAGRADGPFDPPTPTSNIKVRQAVAAAIDPKQFAQRVYNGKGVANTEFFPAPFQFSPKVQGPQYDLAKARQLVQEAKSQGWNGKIRYVCSSDALGESSAQAMSAMLTAAGMEVVVKTVPVTSIEVIVNKDYDLACWAMPGYPDDANITILTNNLRSTSASNRAGYKSPDMDAALTALQVASTDAAKTAAYKSIAETVNRDVPILILGPLPQKTAWASNVHGVMATSQDLVLVDKMWLSK